MVLREMKRDIQQQWVTMRDMRQLHWTGRDSEKQLAAMEESVRQPVTP